MFKPGDKVTVVNYYGAERYLAVRGMYIVEDGEAGFTSKDKQFRLVKLQGIDALLNEDRFKLRT